MSLWSMQVLVISIGCGRRVYNWRCSLEFAGVRWEALLNDAVTGSLQATQYMRDSVLWVVPWVRRLFIVVHMRG
jgi:hypothetical protein